jgi:uroporphyrin-III C-methyltransferase
MSTRPITMRPAPGTHRPRLTVVGAGPGDPELITLKAVRAIATADVVLYDALANEVLLEYARPGAVKQYVGKRKAHKSYTQEALNDLIVEHALLHGHVVRLKGGDPFVFGRGHEEMQYAQSKGIAVAYIPGVSSAVAGAGAAGMAVTLRGASRSFWTLTATTDTGELNPELAFAAQTNTTVVVLMGVSKLAEIAQIWQDAGKDNCPMAVVENATLPQQRIVTGDAQSIAAQVAADPITGPAVIIIGETVRHSIALPEPTHFNFSTQLVTHE